MKSYRKKKAQIRTRLQLAGFFIFLMLTVLFVINDQQISLKMYNPSSWWTSAFEQGGKIAAPVMLLAGVNFICWNHNQIHPRRVYNIIDELAMFIVVILILLNCGGFIGWGQEIIIAVIYSAIYLLIQLKAHKLTWKQRKRLEKIIIMSFAAALIMMPIVELLKNISGRPRFRDLASINDFVPLYKWNLRSPGRSLPSGHTANSCAIIGVTLAAQMFHEKWKRVVVGSLPVIYLIIMAISRVIMGAHFASDAFISLGLVILVWVLVCRIFRYRRRPPKNW